MPALVLALVLLAVAVPAEAQAPGILAYVTRAVDGDTIYAEVSGHIEAVQYLGLVVPYVAHPSRGPAPYAGVAREMNRRLVEGKWVRLVYEREPRDADGRLLAYVWVGDVFVNAALLHWGFAEAAPPAPQVRYAAYFRELQEGAQRDGRGLWRYGDVLTYHRPGGPAIDDVGNHRERAATSSGGRVFSAPNPFLPARTPADSASSPMGSSVVPRGASGGMVRPYFLTLPPDDVPRPGTVDVPGPPPAR